MVSTDATPLASPFIGLNADQGEYYCIQFLIHRSTAKGRPELSRGIFY